MKKKYLYSQEDFKSGDVIDLKAGCFSKKEAQKNFFDYEVKNFGESLVFNFENKNDIFGRNDIDIGSSCLEINTENCKPFCSVGSSCLEINTENCKPLCPVYSSDCDAITALFLKTDDLSVKIDNLALNLNEILNQLI